MRLGNLITAAVLVAAGSVVAVVPAAAAPGPVAAVQLDGTPTASVHPSHGLSVGSTVTVTAAGLPPNEMVNIVQCHKRTEYQSNYSDGCSTGRRVWTSATGTVSAQLSPLATVFVSTSEWSEAPVYCRADICRYFIEWGDDETWVHHSVATNLMYFNGDPATIAAAPKSGLADGQLIQVTGSARKSAGRYVTLVQASCYHYSLEVICLGRLPLATVALRADGTFSASVPAFRFLADGTDCVSAPHGCRVYVEVLGADGEPDDSFAVSRHGDPSVSLTFAS